MKEPEANINQEVKKSHFMNLVSMALMDKQLLPEEIDMLRMLGVKHGLTEEELHNLLFSKVQMGNHHPVSGKDKIIFLYDLVRMMLIDGSLSQGEFEFCLGIAKIYGYGPDLISAMVNTYASGSATEEGRKAIIESLELFMKESQNREVGKQD